MGAILEIPPEVRAAHFSRELDRFVIEALRAVKRQGGERAFNRTRDLVISVCAILAYERGTDVVVGLFHMIERVLTDD
jgi:poly-gamma-glutamate capsule biosynthesis protein CapA/YwtB (metallophosphatase superfamily)